MINPKLGNCSRCGKLFIKLKDICQECYQKQEEDYLKVTEYLRNHPNSTIQQLSDDTKVSVSQIRLFIYANRILVNYFPNLSYPCDSCGNMIQEGRKCSMCLETINQLSARYEKSNPDTNKGSSKLGGYISRIEK